MGVGLGQIQARSIQNPHRRKDGHAETYTATMFQRVGVLDC